MVGVAVYDIDHPHSRAVCDPFYKGLVKAGVDAARYPMGPLRDDGRIACFYGTLRGGIDLLHDCYVYDREYLFIDNGYMGRPDYYRVGRGHRYRIAKAPDYARLDRLGIEIKPWVSNPNGYVFLSPTIQEYDKSWLFHGERWLERTLKQLAKAAPHRKVLVNWKPTDPRYRPGPPLKDVLAAAWMTATYESSVSVDSLIAGVPVYVAEQHPSRAMGIRSIFDVEKPRRPDNRREFLARLAATQWTLEEFADGTAARGLGLA